MSGPLTKLRVLDLSRVLAGPWSTQLLADLGAQVLKVERPEVGDDTRHWGPPFSEQGDAAYFLCANRGKQSVAIDLTTSAGQEWLTAQAKEADILVENFRVGGLAQYGLDYATLSAINPRLIYCSITGFGQTGPCRDRPGYDFLIQAMGGLMSVTGEPDGPPQKVGVAIADIMTGMYATVGILAALAHRERTGEGQHIDLALLDCQIAMLANQNMNYLVGGDVPARLGNAHPNIVPYQTFATADGHLVIAVGNDSQYRRCCGAIGLPELADDGRFARNRDRVTHRDDLIALMAAVLQRHSTRHWTELLNAANVPCGPVNRLDEVFAHPQVQHRNLLIEMTTADGAKVPQVANPIRFEKTPIEYELSPPPLGDRRD